MIGRVRRLLPLAALALSLAGCGSAPPQVTFTAAGTSIDAGPTQYCEDDFVTCTNDATAPVSLSVPPGTPLEVGVPQAVADTPWQVVFTYRTAAGDVVNERTEVQVGSAAYVLQLAADARLLVAEVQQYGPPPQVNATSGEVEFPIRSSWVLTVAGS